MREVVVQANDTVTNDTVEAAEGLGEYLPVSIPPFVLKLILALGVTLFGWYLSKLAVRFAGRTVARRIERPSVTRTILRGVRASVLFVTFLFVLGIFDIGGSTILLPATVFSAVAGIILAPLVGSFVNGMFILTDQPYEIGDMIEVTDQGHRGFVEDITIRYTKIFTLDNTFIVIPNSEIHARDVVNFSAEDERTRLSIDLEITYESDLNAARRTIERAARDVDEVITGGPDIRIGSARYPAAPQCYINEYAESGVLLTLRFWAIHPYKLLTIRSAVQERIESRLETIDVDIAYPHTHHVFDETSGIARVAAGDALDGNARGETGSVDPSEPLDSDDRSSEGPQN